LRKDFESSIHPPLEVGLNLILHLDQPLKTRKLALKNYHMKISSALQS